MVSLAKFRERLQNRLFNNDLAGTLTIKKYDTTTDKWGDATETLASSTDVTAVIYDYLSARKEFESFGEIQNSEMVAVVPYDTDIKSDSEASETDNVYKVVYGSDTFRVVEVVKYPYGGGTLAIAVRLAKEV